MLSRDPLIRKLAQTFSVADQSHQFLGFPKGTLRGTIVDIEDPKEQGRVKVVFDDMNPAIPQGTGVGEFSDKRVGEEPDQSHWIDTSPAFQGKQPKGVLGKRVNISISNGQYQFAVLQDVMFDPQILATSEKSKLKIPNNSTMTRLPVYEAGKMPQPSEENYGCTVIEEGGPYGDDWLCVCLKRSGMYIWVRHIDMQHGHAGSNDYSQMPDTGGDKQQPVKSSAVWDYVFPTSIQEMRKFSAYDTDPRGNPWGDKVKWFPPPETKKDNVKDLLSSLLPDVFNTQVESVDFTRGVSGFVPNIPGSFSPTGGTPIPDSLPYPNFTLE